MIVRIVQLADTARFASLTHVRHNDVRFRKLTLIYGRNASGKSTLTRVLAAACTRDVAAITNERRLGSPRQPRATLELDGGGYLRFEGTWSEKEATLPIKVFDRYFIESNIFEGRRSTKEQRKGLLVLALGAAEVEHARTIDQLSADGRQLSIERRTQEQILIAAAEANELSLDDFLALPLHANADQAIADAEAVSNDARRADEILRRGVPGALPDLPFVDLPTLSTLLAATAKTIGDDIESRVREHFQNRLHGHGEQWVRQGLGLIDGGTCPFCAQSVQGSELVAGFRSWFDDAYSQILAQLQDSSEQIATMTGWWRDVVPVGQANNLAFLAWADVDGVSPLSLDSARQKVRLDRVGVLLSEAVGAKRANPLEAIDRQKELTEACSLIAEIRAAIATYNESIGQALERINERRAQLRGLDLRDSERAVRLARAARTRHSGEALDAALQREQLISLQSNNDAQKRAAETRLKNQTNARLDEFTKRVNAHLSSLGAEFSLTDLEAERTGGRAGAKYTLVLASDAKIAIKGGASEEAFMRVLSDGDRATLALALFLTTLDDLPDLDKHLLVFDDPMTSLDLHRAWATAEQITRVARKARQVVVLSHHAPFLAQLAHDWQRHAPESDMRELELDRGSCELRGWSAEAEVTHEHLKRWKEIQAYIDDPKLDDRSSHIHGEIRKYVEAQARFRWPELFASNMKALEPVIRDLRKQPGLLATTGLTPEGLESLDRVCHFGAAGNHPGGHTVVPPPSPEEVRRMAVLALKTLR